MTFGPSASLRQRGFEGERSSTESTSRGSLQPRVDHTGRQFPKEGGSDLPGLLPARLGFAAEGTDPPAVAAAPGDALRPRAQQPLDWSHRGPGPPSTQELFLLSLVQGRLHCPHLLPPARHQHVFLLSVPLSAARHPHPGRSQRQAGVGCESHLQGRCRPSQLFPHQHLQAGHEPLQASEDTWLCGSTAWRVLLASRGSRPWMLLNLPVPSQPQHRDPPPVPCVSRAEG